MNATVSGLDAPRQEVLDKLLLEAVGNRDLAHVQLYVEKGANPNMSAGHVQHFINRNGNGMGLNREAPLLHFLYSKGLNKDVADYLIAQGVDVDGRDAHGNTALMVAVKQGDLSAARYFVSKGADPMSSNYNREIVMEEARNLSNYYHSDRQALIDMLVSAMPSVNGVAQRPQAAESVEMPPATPATPLQKRLNNRFQP